MGLKVVLKVIQTCWDTIFEFTFPDFGAKIQIIFLLLNGYLLYGKRLKRFRRNEILFYAENVKNETFSNDFFAILQPFFGMFAENFV